MYYEHYNIHVNVIPVQAVGYAYLCETLDFHVVCIHPEVFYILPEAFSIPFEVFLVAQQAQFYPFQNDEVHLALLAMCSNADPNK